MKTVKQYFTQPLQNPYITVSLVLLIFFAVFFGVVQTGVVTLFNEDANSSVAGLFLNALLKPSQVIGLTLLSFVNPENTPEIIAMLLSLVVMVCMIAAPVILWSLPAWVIIYIVERMRKN